MSTYAYAAATARFEAAFATGQTVPFEVMPDCGGSICNWMASAAVAAQLEQRGLAVKLSGPGAISAK